VISRSGNGLRARKYSTTVGSARWLEVLVKDGFVRFELQPTE
jgi:hypothetical protein